MYSREEILGMVAGRELDELVAREVMGLGRYEGNWEDKTGKFAYSVNEFCPSREIESAWEVVDKLYAQPVLQKIAFSQEVGDYIFTITPELICKAALLSLLKED